MLTTISAPSVEPMTATDEVLRQRLRLMSSETERDQLIDAEIATARDEIEAFTRRRLITQTLRLTLDGFGCHGSAEIPLGVAPVQSIESVEYLDDNGTWQTVSSSLYRLIDSRSPPAVAPVFGQVWPVPRPDRATVRIEFKAGYGDAGSDVPARFLDAIRLQVAHMQMSDVVDGKSGDLCEAVRRKLASSVVWV